MTDASSASAAPADDDPWPGGGRMLFLHNGPFSGIAPAVLQAWRSGCPNLHIETLDLGAPRGVVASLRALPSALRKGGPAVLLMRGGRFGDAVASSAYAVRMAEKTVDRFRRQHDVDFALVVGSTLPGYELGRPYFVYTDHPILANHYFPGGAQRVEHWRDILPYETRNLERAERIFAMSSHAERTFHEKYRLPRERVVRVNAGHNTLPPRDVDPGRFQKANILFVGVDWERKGGPELLEAFRRVRAEIPHAQLTIVGCSPAITDGGVTVVGAVSPSCVPDFYARATVFCLPSRREPFGIVYLEALRSGLPVVSLDLGATPDFVINNETGYRVPPGDVDALSRCLLGLVRDPEKCRRLGEAGRALMESSYTWSRTQQKMSRAVREALAAH